MIGAAQTAVITKTHLCSTRVQNHVTKLAMMSNVAIAPASKPPYKNGSSGKFSKKYCCRKVSISALLNPNAGSI